MNKKYLQLLREFIALKSVSNDSAFKKDINKTVEWLTNKFKENKFSVQVIKGYDNPIVIAEYRFDNKLPTVLVYGHYDVQPASKEDGWTNEPFEVTEDKKRYYGRGIVDNKGQILIHIATVFELIKKDKLNYNVKFILEGDEETGSENILKFFDDHTDKLKTDYVLISDGELSDKHACLDSSFRGIVNFSLRIKTSDKDNHSGLYGGSMPNAANELAKLLDKMHDEKGNLTIKGINENVKLSKSTIKNNKNLPYSAKEFSNITGAKLRFSESKLDFYSQTGFYTSAEVTSISGGYLGSGFKNAIPGIAVAKINFRMAPDLSVKETIKLFNIFVKKNLPSYVAYELKAEQFSDGFFVDSQNDFATKAKEILKKVYKAEVFDRPCGAIIPIVGNFIKYLKVPVISVGLANEDCNMHGANENFEKDKLQKALEFSRIFFSR